MTVALFAACGEDETLRSAAPGAADAGPVSPPKPDAGKEDVSLPVKRRVFSRNPFGNVHAKDNLLWDGDFEWHTQFAQQYGWVNAAQLVTVGALETLKVGPECRSGMKCGLLTQNQRIAGVGISPGDVNVSASVWIRIPTTDCSDMGATLIACDYAEDTDVPLVDVDGKPDAEGWCHYEAVSAPRKRATCLYIDARFAEGEALVDDAVVRAAPGSTPSSRVLSASEQRSVDQARKVIRQRLRPAPPERRDAAEALERWARRAR